MSEQGFYLPMTLVEMSGGSILYDLYSASNYMNEGNNKKLNEILINLSKKIKLVTRFTHMTNLVWSPELFFNELRIYLGGFNKKDYFPEGLKIDRIENKRFSFNGGSAAQSSLIQVFDIFLSVEHNKSMNDFYLDTRNYMPIRHRNLLEDMEKMRKIKDYICEDSDPEKILISNYNKCIQNLLKFREAHSLLIRNYVFKFTGKPSTHGVKGSAGTNPQDVINDTIQATRNGLVNKQQTVFENASIP